MPFFFFKFVPICDFFPAEIWDNLENRCEYYIWSHTKQCSLKLYVQLM